MVIGMTACGTGGGGSSTQGGTSSNKSGKVKIGVSIWSSTDVLGSQCKKILDEAAKALDVEVQYVDQGHVSEKVTASVEQLAAAGCQGIIICNSSDTRNAELSMAQIDAVAVAAGPGSFTGIRIAAAKGPGLGQRDRRMHSGGMAWSLAHTDGWSAPWTPGVPVYNALFGPTSAR